jgi:tetratricopeptide (TPR) repeat protein
VAVGFWPRIVVTAMVSLLLGGVLWVILGAAGLDQALVVASAVAGVAATLGAVWVSRSPPAGVTGAAGAVAADSRSGGGPRAGQHSYVGWTVARTLPADLTAFTGRETELAALMRHAQEERAAGVIGISVIDGMPGIGKTALAVHAAHRLAPGFPDGQLFVRLHAHTPGREPVAPEDALFELLRGAGVAPRQIPPGLDSRERLWRDLMSGRKVLLVLDDAASTDKIQPLLPGSAGTLVLVTSRHRLTALPGALPVTIDVLGSRESADLFIKAAGRPDLQRDDDAVARVVMSCGRLPLAIALMAGQLRHHPARTAAALAADLDSAAKRLPLLAAENVSVAAAFGFSYGNLTTELQRLFRRLGLHPGTEFDAYAAAALDGTDPDTARTRLDGLFGDHLIEEPVLNRYRFHDLIGEHARTLGATDPPADRDAAEGRLLDYYLNAARAADRHLARSTPIGICPPADAGSLSGPDLPTRERALEWMDAERPNLDAVVAHAAQQGRPGHATAIAHAVHGFLRSQGHWQQARNLHSVALAAARQIGPHEEAGALLDLATAERLTGDYPAAASSLGRALELYRDLGDSPGQAGALSALGHLQRVTGDYPAAMASLGQALTLYRDLGHQYGQATALINLGAAQNEKADYPAAEASLRQALQLYRDAGDQHGQANALNDLATMQHNTGSQQEAATTLGQALELYRNLGDRLGEANSLSNLAEMQLLAGDYPAANASLDQAQRLAGDCTNAMVTQSSALALYQELGDPHGQASALTYLGAAQQATGDGQAASDSLHKALGLFRDLDEKLGQAEVLNNLGELSLAQAATGEARERFSEGLHIATAIAMPTETARALEGLAQCHLREDQYGQARELFGKALKIYQKISLPNADRIEIILNGLS